MIFLFKPTQMTARELEEGFLDVRDFVGLVLDQIVESVAGGPAGKVNISLDTF